MKKQGFTLIELMVVIVIMGILAAVAVPKLFGMIAKSKASEVGPAAGTYVKLQDAYVSEKGDKLGNWNEIGYKMPSGGAFDYYDGTTKITAADGKSGAAAASSELSAGLSPAWKAEPKVALNDCQALAANAWIINVTQNGTEGGVALYEATNANADCLALTPSFTKLTTKAASTTTGGEG